MNRVRRTILRIEDSLQRLDCARRRFAVGGLDLPGIGITIVLSLFFAGTAFAAYPLDTDDAGTQGKGKFQIEVNGQAGFDENNAAAGQRIQVRDEALAAVFSYGALNEVDVVVGVLYRDYVVKAGGEKVAADDGYSDVVVEVKWRFLEEDGFTLALKPGLILPTGDEQEGLGTGKVGYGATLIAGKELESFTVLVNFGYLQNENTVEEEVALWRLSAGVLYRATEHLQLGAELGQATSTDKSIDRYPAFALLGAIYSFSESFDAGIGVRKALNGPEADLIYRAGVAFRF